MVRAEKHRGRLPPARIGLGEPPDATPGKSSVREGGPRGLLGRRRVFLPMAYRGERSHLELVGDLAPSNSRQVQRARSALEDTARMNIPRPFDRDTSDPSAGARRPRQRPERRLTCRLTTLHPERALSLALVQHMAEELPDIEFTLEDRAEIDVVWVCGYERGNPDAIRQLRARHPLTVLLVTAKESAELWSGEVRDAGADSALSWPVDLGRLSRALHRPRLQRRA